MPLDPKQQPPYYTPGTAGTIDNKYTRINAQYAVITTSGTTETDLYTYTLPANALPTNGSGLTIKFVTQNTAGNGDDHRIRFYIDAVQQFTANSNISPDEIIWTITLIRISSTQLAMQATTEIGSSGGIYNIQTAGSLDFTDTIPIKFTGKCEIDGVIQTYFMTIDKIII